MTPNGAKSFVFEQSLKNRTIRRTIGSVTADSIEGARTEAKRLSVMLDAGTDPREFEREQAEAKAAAAAAAAATASVCVCSQQLNRLPPDSTRACAWPPSGGQARMSAPSIQPKLQNRALTARKQRFLTAVHIKC